ncbi:MAG: hypothetical protein ACW96X_01920 [Promethearchaeota archaeon]|jgi:hypothetical protein
MVKELFKGLKIVFLIDFILGLILGIVFLFIPETYCNLVGVVMTDHGVLRLIGAASLALGSSSFLAYRSKDWEKAKLLVQMDLIWLISGIVGLVWWLIESGPVAAWWVFGMFVAFLVAFGYFYLLQEK